MRRVLIIPDAHAPSHDKRAVEAVCAYTTTKHYDDIVLLGDLGDFDSLNAYNSSFPGLQEGKRLAKDLEACVSVLDDFTYSARRVNPNCRAHYLLGNHEARLFRETARTPAFMGITSFEDALDLDVKAIKLYPYTKRKAAMRIGKLHFLHGSYFGENAVKKHLDRLSCSFVMGHIHRLLTVTKPSQHGTMLGASVGHLADPDIGESYLDGPEGWQQGFGEAFVRDNGTFNLYPIAILNGSFVAPDGREYSSRGWDRLLPPIGLSRSTTPASDRGPDRSPSGLFRAPLSGQAPSGTPRPRKKLAVTKSPSR